MDTLLHIDSSPLYGRSVSRELTGAFVAQWKSSHPNGTVVDRDLNATSIPPINADWVAAVYTPEEARTPQQEALLSLSERPIRRSAGRRTFTQLIYVSADRNETPR